MSSEADVIRVLHVDDDEDLCDLAALRLERANDDLVVRTATSAAAGLELLGTEEIDCVVSDHDMPGRDGLEFLRAVRERDDDLPFILYTGKGSEEIASEAISAGVTDYLQKGTTGDQYDLLANRVERAVSAQRARRARAESERMFSTLVSNLPGMVYRCRNVKGWPMEFVSDGASELSGYSASALENGDVDWGEEVIHEDDRDHLWEQVQLALAADEPFEVTYRIHTAAGELRWLWERGRKIDRPDEDADVIEGFITDITARRARERELATEREFTRKVIDALRDVFVVMKPDGSIVRWNDRTSEVSGYADSEIARMSAPDFFDDGALDRIVAARDEALETGAATVEAALVTRGDERRRYEFRLATVSLSAEAAGESDADGVERRICAVGRDVDTARQRQQELERYETVIQAVGDPVYTLDADGHFTFANEALGLLTGYRTDELVGEHIDLIMDDEDVEVGREEIRQLLDDDDRQYAIFEMDVLTRDGDRVPSENHIALLPMADGEFRGTAGVIRDVSDRKERERRLEEFASVVSHDLRNPLEVLSGRVELARRTGDVSHLDELERPLDRMEQLIEDLLRLAHRGEGVDELQSIDLATTAHDAWYSIDADEAALTVAGSRSIEADPGRFQALLENLFRNALEHGMSEDADSGAPASTITVVVGETSAGFFVEDDGVGIPEDDRDTVFERGYTTQRDGTGYGLAIVADVVDAHGWSVRVTESDDGGARFEFDV